ncbi:MAG TPA: hypothetical protein VGA78_18120 [Gemmatimonadales bacterium]|jgi:hypothetical protein
MLEVTPRLRQFEREYQRWAYRSLTFHQALARYRAMLHEARRLRPDLGLDWRQDLASDLAMARVLNGLPSA